MPMDLLIDFLDCTFFLDTKVFLLIFPCLTRTYVLFFLFCCEDFVILSLDWIIINFFSLTNLNYIELSQNNFDISSEDLNISPVLK